MSSRLNNDGRIQQKTLSGLQSLKADVVYIGSLDVETSILTTESNLNSNVANLTSSISTTTNYLNSNVANLTSSISTTNDYLTSNVSSLSSSISTTNNYLSSNVATINANIANLEIKTQNMSANTGNTSFSGIVNFGSVVGDKIQLFANSYGIGISASQLNTYFGSTASARWYAGGNNNSGSLCMAVSNTATTMYKTLSVSGNTSLANVSTTGLTSTSTLSATGNTSLTGSSVFVSGTFTANTIVSNGAQVYPVLVYGVRHSSGLGSGDIEFTNIPTWVRHIVITFHQLGAYVADSSALFYFQPGSSSGYWDTATYCGAMNVLSLSAVGGSALNSMSYVPFTESLVNTGATNGHFSGLFRMERLGFYGTEDIWTFDGSWYWHANGWSCRVGGSVRGKHANQQLSKIRMVNDTTAMDGQKWVGACNMDYW